MKSGLSWKSAGLEVAGRTKRLRKSCRCTWAILEAANAVLALCGAADSDDFLSPVFAGMPPGTKPRLVRVDSPRDVDRVVNEVAVLGTQEHLPPDAVLVVPSERAPRDALDARLVRALGRERVWWVNQRGQKKEPPVGQGNDCMRLASVDTATGVEAGVVFLLGLEDLCAPGAPPGLGEEELAQRRERQFRKLHMAMTRAGRRLVLVSTEPLPAAVQGTFDPG
jgi:superfamily I DNA/RNA helicase